MKPSRLVTSGTVFPCPPPSNDRGGASVYYPNCKAATAAGAAPLYAGRPGYRTANTLSLNADMDLLL
jgi:Excalibur calcium-binding domain